MKCICLNYSFIFPINLVAPKYLSYRLEILLRASHQMKHKITRIHPRMMQKFQHIMFVFGQTLCTKFTNFDEKEREKGNNYN